MVAYLNVTLYFISITLLRFKSTLNRLQTGFIWETKIEILPINIIEILE